MTDHNDFSDDRSSRNARERELLSALMDGETSEHELHQALKAAGDDRDLAAAWSRWHVAQSVLRGENVRPAPVDLRAAVAAAIDGDVAAGAPARPASTRPAWLRPLASVAVAAGVAVVTVLGWQALRGDSQSVAGNDAQTVALGSMVVVREDGEELATAGESPTAGQDRLNAYLARHAQAATLGTARGLASYARVVSFEGEQGR